MVGRAAAELRGDAVTGVSDLSYIKIVISLSEFSFYTSEKQTEFSEYTCKPQSACA